MTKRFGKIITNATDYFSFRRAGLAEAFTTKCISDKEIEVADHYYDAME